MSNVETARLVRSVVAERGLLPIMSNFHIYDGRIQGTDGKMTLDAPWDWEGDPINVSAAPFVKAFENMETPTLELKGDHLLAKHKRMRVKIPMSLDSANPFPRCERPSGDWMAMDNTFLEACRRVRSFVGTDMARQWSNAVLVRDGWVYATNNVSLARTRFDWEGPEFTVPAYALDQLARTGLEIDGFFLEPGKKVAFSMGDVWLESSVYEHPWPDVQDMIPDCTDLPEIPEGLAAAVDKVLPFVPDSSFPVIKLCEDKVSTLEGDMSAEIELACPAEAAFNATPLRTVLSYARFADFSAYPQAVPFRNAAGNLEGLIMGVRT